MRMDSIKLPQTTFALAPLLRERWSARSFTDQPIAVNDLKSTIEAATWAFSANNEQPWRFIAATRGTLTYQKILNALAPGNAAWANKAGALVVSMAKTDFEKEGNPVNKWADHDLGAANMNLILQALSLNIYAHPMGGFDEAKLRESFALPHNLKPVVVIALGYLGDADALEEPFRTREKTPRKRKQPDEVLLQAIE